MSEGVGATGGRRQRLVERRLNEQASLRDNLTVHGDNLAEPEVLCRDGHAGWNARPFHDEACVAGQGARARTHG